MTEEKNIIITNSEVLEKTKEAIASGGGENIHVLADFDRTLTKAFVDGEKVPSMISILRDRKESYLTKDYAEKAHALFDKYHPIEIDPNVSGEDKKKAMNEWWMTHFDLLIESKLNKKDIEKAIESDKLRLREGCSGFLSILSENNIPLVIMSSNGLGGDSISMFLDKRGKLTDNVLVISNAYEWDDDGYATGVKEPIIHGMNKDETAIQGFPAFDVVKDRKNVILLGDSPSDVGMVEGFDYENILKIGFLNEPTEDRIEDYKKYYDVIITDDVDMGYVNELIGELVGV